MNDIADQEFNEKYFDCIYHSIHNAQRFLDDAKLLMKKRSFGHAASLAVLGQEECAKSYRYLIAFMENEEVEKRDDFLTNHKIKHIFSLIFRYAFSSPVLLYMEEALDKYLKEKYKEKKKELKRRIKKYKRELKGIKPDDFTPELFEEFQNIAMEVFDIPEFITQLGKEIEEDSEIIEETKKYVEEIKNEFDLIIYKRKLNNIKERGFYIDCHREGVFLPQQLTKQEAKIQISNLNQVLDNTTKIFGDIELEEMKLKEKQQFYEILKHNYEQFKSGKYFWGDG